MRNAQNSIGVAKDCAVRNFNDLQFLLSSLVFSTKTGHKIF